VQPATVTLQNNGHDETEHQQQRIRSHHDHLLRRFLHPQLPKVIIARREEWKSCIVRVFWYADDLGADMATLNINDNTSDFATRRRVCTKKLDRDKQTVDSHLLLQIVVGQICPFNPTRRVCVLLHGHRTINVQWKRDCGACGPLGRMQNE
jgi:hypothetical protein